MSKDIGYEASQSITTIGIIEQTIEGETADDLIKATAKRSVFTAAELSKMASASEVPVKIINFLLVGHVSPPVPLNVLLSDAILSAAPQSITKLSEGQYLSLKSRLHLGFSW